VRFAAPVKHASIASLNVPLVRSQTIGSAVAPAPALSEPVESASAPTDLFATDAASEFQADRVRIESVLAQLKPSVEKLRQEQSQRLVEWQRAAIELAMTLATRLLRDKIVSGEFPIETKVRDMIAQMDDDSPATLYLNPSDIELLEARLEGAPLLPGREDPRVVPDATLSRGECRVEGREGMLLSDLTRELQEIRDDLLRSLAHARS